MKNTIIAFVYYYFLLFLVVTPFSTIAQDQVLEKWHVTYVVDGDTFYAESDSVGRTKFRLIGIDTPESRHLDKPKQPFSAEATALTKHLIDRVDVLIEYDIQRYDKYNRTLAYVYLINGTFLNEVLLQKGLAQTMTIPPNIKYSEQFTRTQKQARINEVGLWGLTIEN